jgi:MoxR-like ATPase
MSLKKYQQVSESPTRPVEENKKKDFDVADLYNGPVTDADADSTTVKSPLDEKLRQAYFWITNHAIISPYYDVEYNDNPPQRLVFGDDKAEVTLPTDQSYSSYVLLPLLNLAVRRRCLLVGGPGRGKTAIAILMGVISGYKLSDIKRSIQHGQPQMTIADLLGNPLPSTLVNAKSMDEVVIAWRKWLGMGIKIIDEYNRIPTRTQSALLTVMGDNYAEIYDQIFECPPAAWYLTANDDAGGGTYKVIDALRDRIDVVVKALHFNTRFLDDLLIRIEDRIRPEEVVPPQILFSPDELDQMENEILSIDFPSPLRRRFEFFAGNFEFFEAAAKQIEYRTKDTAKLSGIDFSLIAADETGKDKSSDLGFQTLNGLSVRAMMTSIVFVKAMAYFRGAKAVTYDDLRQILPFVLQDKLVQNRDSPFFELSGNNSYRVDLVSWVRNLFDDSNKEFDRLAMDKNDVVADFTAAFDKGLEGISEKEVKFRLIAVEKALREMAKGKKFYGHMFDDILKLKYFHQRYTNYHRWLRWKK